MSCMAARKPSRPDIHSWAIFLACHCMVSAAGSTLSVTGSTTSALASTMSVAQSIGAAGIYESVLLQPFSKWSICFENGRMNIIFSVDVAHTADKVFAGLGLPEQVSKCTAQKASACKALVACESATSCHKFFPGEMSGREKCLVVLNPTTNDQDIQINVELQSPGNWGAIIFGVVASSCGLLAVILLGCYSDVTGLLAKHSKKKGASRRSSKVLASSVPALIDAGTPSSLHHQ